MCVSAGWWSSPLNTLDYVALAVCILSLLGETIADEQQWQFQVCSCP